MLRLLCLCLLFMVASAWAEVPEQRHARLFDASEDQLLLRETVPRGGSPQGELRLLIRGQAVVVQTLLYSKILKKVLAAVDAKEARFWPEGRKGALDSRKYVEMLYRNFEKIWSEFRRRQDRAERRQGMLIEFILSRRTALVAIYSPGVIEVQGRLELIKPRLLEQIRVSRAYGIGNLVEISSDSLGLRPPQLFAMLEGGLGNPGWLRNDFEQLKEEQGP